MRRLAVFAVVLAAVAEVATVVAVTLWTRILIVLLLVTLYLLLVLCFLRWLMFSLLSLTLSSTLCPRVPLTPGLVFWVSLPSFRLGLAVLATSLSLFCCFPSVFPLKTADTVLR